MQGLLFHEYLELHPQAWIAMGLQAADARGNGFAAVHGSGERNILCPGDVAQFARLPLHPDGVGIVRIARFPDQRQRVGVVSVRSIAVGDQGATIVSEMPVILAAISNPRNRSIEFASSGQAPTNISLVCPNLAK